MAYFVVSHRRFAGVVRVKGHDLHMDQACGRKDKDRERTISQNDEFNTKVPTKLRNCYYYLVIVQYKVGNKVESQLKS